MCGYLEAAIKRVRELAALKQLTRAEVAHRAISYVPVLIVAYNWFLNIVDHMDQRKSRNPLQRKEMRLEMSVFTVI